MRIDKPTHLLFIEPQKSPSKEPVEDRYTQILRAAWEKQRTSLDSYRGFHLCKCGARSSNRDHFVGPFMTNSLCLHYVMHHRDEVPESELVKILQLA